MKQRLFAQQPFWITVALFVCVLLLSLRNPGFLGQDNLFNISRNIAFVAIVALGQTAVILTAGIDLSVGSIMGLSAVVTGVALHSGMPLAVGLLLGLGVALLCGLVNGWLIGYVELSPFVVTLAMLAVARSLALVVSNNQMVYEFGPDSERFLALGGGSTLGVAHPVWLMLLLVAVVGFVLRFTRFGQYLYAIGNNEQAAHLVGLPVARIKLMAYMLSAGLAGVSAVLMVGWLGSVTNALGQSYELRVIAASVIGGANLMGGEGGAYGSLVGAALLEVIRNGLLLIGVDPYWQGTFVGLFILLAVLLDRYRSRGRER